MKVALLRITRRSSYQNRVPTFHQFSSVPDLKKYLLNNAAKLKNLKHATQIHSQIVTTNHASLANINTLLLLYAKCGSIHHALLVFATTPHASTNVVTWTTLITRLAHSNKPFQALTCFNRMRTTGISPNQFTFSAILPACAHATLLSHGQQIHALIHKRGFETDTFVATALVDMYAKCGSMPLAEEVFDQMPHRNLVSWNCMVVGFLKNKLYGRAIGVFKSVLGETLLCPDQVSFSSVLSACAGLVELDFGKQVHGSIVKRGLTAKKQSPMSAEMVSIETACFRVGSES
ncbi:putative pentatricopeptide repeat-containing protein mitochondrial [Spatholobus suberectus]|nr:putative pentatricopeptide repeat-containing protein mitochondrial [Spatholobus suberectus]